MTTVVTGRVTAGSLALLLAVMTIPKESAAATRERFRSDSTLALATFDSAWTRIGRTYYDSTMRGIDWSAVRDELRPRAARARTATELRPVLHELLGRLGESHFLIIPAEAAEVIASVEGDSTSPPSREGDVGVHFRMVGGRLLVTRVDPDGPGWTAGVRAGWELSSVDGQRVESVITRLTSLLGDRHAQYVPIQTVRAFEAKLAGTPGTRVVAQFRNERRHATTVRITRRPVKGRAVSFGFLPVIIAEVEHRRIERGRDCVGIVRLSAWMAPVAAALDSAIAAERECGAIVLDLRGNTGGLAAMVMGVAGYFLENPDSLGTLRLRNATIHLVVNPRYVDAGGHAIEPYRGKLAILIDELSASTSEIFAAAMQQRGRARIFGNRSPGFALPANVTRLPNHDLLMHVIADFTLANGDRVEGKGVLPDVEIPLTRTDLLAGRDPALDMAVEWAASGAQ